MAVIYSNSLKVQSSVEADGGVVEFVSSDTNLFDASNGFSPGENGRLEMEAVLTAQNKTDLETAGTITLMVSKEAMAINDSESGIFSQSFGQVRTTNAGLITIRRETTPGDGRLTWGKHANGAMITQADDGTASVSNAGVTTTTAGKGDYVEFKLTWTSGGGTIDQWIEGVLYNTFTSAVDFTTVTGLFDRFRIGGDQNGGLEEDPGNNIFIKDMVVEDNYYNPAIDLQVAVVGDSFAVSGKTPGGEFYDGGYLWEIQRFYMQERGLRVVATPFASSGQGYSPEIDPVNNLSDEVTAAVAADPDVIIFQGSVNDLQDDIANPVNLVSDYQSSMEGYVDQAIANSNISEIYVTSILQWLRAYPPTGTNTGNKALRETKSNQADVILAGLSGRGQAKFLNAIVDLGGRDTYSIEYTIGSATGTDDDSDFHPSGEGHSAIGQSIGSLILLALSESPTLTTPYSIDIAPGDTAGSATNGTVSTIVAGTIKIFLGATVDLTKRQSVIGSLKVLFNFMMTNAGKGEVTSGDIVVYGDYLNLSQYNITLTDNTAGIGDNDVAIVVSSSFGSASNQTIEYREGYRKLIAQILTRSTGN